MPELTLQPGNVRQLAKNFSDIIAQSNHALSILSTLTYISKSAASGSPTLFLDAIPDCCNFYPEKELEGMDYLVCVCNVPSLWWNDSDESFVSILTDSLEEASNEMSEERKKAIRLHIR